jgi:hypothetical protein
MKNFIAVDERELGKPHIRKRNPVLQAGMPTLPGAGQQGYLITLDIIRQNLYTFYQVAVANTLVPQSIFTIGKGGTYLPIGGAGFQFTKLQTNLLTGSAGGLANPQRFMCQGISRYVREDIFPDDLVYWNFSTYVELDIGDTEKPYAQMQLIQIPQPSAANIQYAPSNTDTGSGATTGWPINDNYYPLIAERLIDPNTGLLIHDSGITIDQGQFFALVLDPTLTSGAFPVYKTQGGGTAGGTGINAYFHLVGVLGRSAQ